MKVNPLKEALNALKEYLNNYTLKEVVENKQHTTRLNSIYKKYHALLVWHAYLNSNKSKIKVSDKDNFFLFFNEVVSDICQTLFLWNHGLYKPCYLVLRSSLENQLKCIGLHQEQAILEISSTYDLFSVINGTEIVTDNENVSNSMQYYRSKYVEMCGYVHTSTESNMSLTTAIGIFPFFDIKKSDISSKMIQGIIKNNVITLCFMFPNILKKMHHSDYDSVSNILPKNVRKQIGKF